MTFNKMVEILRSDYTKKRFGRLSTDTKLGSDWMLLQYQNGMRIQIRKPFQRDTYMLATYHLGFTKEIKDIDEVFEWYQEQRIEDLKTR